MQLGSHKPLGLSTPLGQTVQRFEQLGALTSGKLRQRQIAPTLGQKLQATFQARPEQNDSIASSELASAPSVSAQFIDNSAAAFQSAEPIDRPKTTQSTAPSEQPIESIDRPEPTNSSTLEKLAPLGKLQPLADRQSLSQPENFLSLKAEPSVDQATSSGAKQGQLAGGATPTPDRIRKQIQTQIQTQLETRSPTQPPIDRSPEQLATTIQTSSAIQTSTDTEAASIKTTRSTPNVQQLFNPQAEISRPLAALEIDRIGVPADTKSAAIEADTQISSAQILQQKAEPQPSFPKPLADEKTDRIQLEASLKGEELRMRVAPNQIPDEQPAESQRSIVDPAQRSTVDSVQRSAQDESIAPSTPTADEDLTLTPTSDAVAPSISSSGQTSASMVQLQPNVPSASKPHDAAIPPSEPMMEAAIQRQDEPEAERAIEPANDLLLAKPSESTQTATSQFPFQPSATATPDPDTPQPQAEPETASLEPEAVSPQAASQRPDRTPLEPSQPTPADSIQRSPAPVQPDLAIAPSQPAAELSQESPSTAVEQNRSGIQPSIEQPAQQQRSSTNLEANPLLVTAQPQVEQARSSIAPSTSQPSVQPQIQAKQSTAKPEAAEVASSMPQSSTPEAVSAPVKVELAIEQPSSDRSAVSPESSETESIAPFAIQLQIDPLIQSPQPRQEESSVLDHSTALKPLSLSSESANIQRQAEVTKAETVESSEELPAAIAPSSSDQPDINSVQEAQNTIQTRQAPEAKPTAPSSETTTSFDQPVSIANESVSLKENSAIDGATASGQPQIQPAIQEPSLQAKTELSEPSDRSIEPSQQQPSARSNPSASTTVEQSDADTVQPNHTELLLQRQPLGLAKPLAEPPDLLMPKLDLQHQADRASDLAAIEPTVSASDSPDNWSSIDELLNQSNAGTSEAWQQQFQFQSSTPKEFTSPIADRSTSTATVDSPSPQADSEQQYTLTSSIATSTQPKEAIDEQQQELMAQLVYARIRDRVAVDQERYFQTASNNPPWLDIVSPEFFKSVKLAAQPDSPNAQQQTASIVYPPQRHLEELSQMVYQLIQQRLEQDRERSRWKYR